MVATNIGEQVIEKPDRTRFLKSVYEDKSGLYTMVEGKRQRLEDRGKVVDSRGKKVYEYVLVGRPRQFPRREKTSWEMSQELLDEINRRRGSLGRSIYIEQELRKAWGMPPLEEIGN